MDIPKILSNARELLVAEARRQVSESGYASMTIRSVARACGMAVGTVYNYFPSKDMLTAAFVLEDWNECIAGACERTAGAQSGGEALRCVYECMEHFIADHRRLFSDEEAFQSYAAAMGRWHGELRRQLAELIRPHIGGGRGDADFTAEFVAESVIVWSSENKPFETVYPVLNKIISE